MFVQLLETLMMKIDTRNSGRSLSGLKLQLKNENKNYTDGLGGVLFSSDAETLMFATNVSGPESKHAFRALALLSLHS